MGNRRVGGIIFVKVNGTGFQAKGEFTYNLGKSKREAVVGMDVVHGYKEEPQVPFIAGKITDKDDLDLETVLAIKDATATLELANGKVIVLREAWYASEGEVSTAEGEIDFRLEGISAREVT